MERGTAVNYTPRHQEPDEDRAKREEADRLIRAAARAEDAMELIAACIPSIVGVADMPSRDVRKRVGDDTLVRGVRAIRVLELTFALSARAGLIVSYLWLACGKHVRDGWKRPSAAEDTQFDVELSSMISGEREVTPKKGRPRAVRGLDKRITGKRAFVDAIRTWMQAETIVRLGGRAGQTDRLDLVRLVETLSRIRAWRAPGQSDDVRDAELKRLPSSQSEHPIACWNPKCREIVWPSWTHCPNPKCGEVINATNLRGDDAKRWYERHRRKIREHARNPTEFPLADAIDWKRGLSAEFVDGCRHVPSAGGSDEQWTREP